MPAKGYASITVSEGIYRKLKETYNKETSREKVKLSLSKWTEKYLWDVIEENEAWRGYMPFLQEEEITEEGIFIRDNRLNRLVQLSIKEGDLFCDLDRASNCVHIGFAWSIPQVYRAMKEHGRKQPK